MTTNAQFSNTSPRFNLPYLYPAQAQKEFFVNEAHALIDALLHPCIESEVSVPPVSHDIGQIWLVGAPGSGEWSGQEGRLAVSRDGHWHFLTPTSGMVVFDRSSSQQLIFADGWRRTTTPAEPTGGVTIDAELRLAFTNLIEALKNAGIFSQDS